MGSGFCFEIYILLSILVWMGSSSSTELICYPLISFYVEVGTTRTWPVFIMVQETKNVSLSIWIDNLFNYQQYESNIGSELKKIMNKSRSI